MSKHPSRRYIDCVSIWGSTRLEMPSDVPVLNKRSSPADDDNSDSNEYELVTEIDLNTHPEMAMGVLKELFFNATALNFMLVREPAAVMEYVCREWQAISCVKMACHINNLLSSSSSAMPEMTRAVSAYPASLKKLKLQYWYADKEFITALLQNQCKLAILALDVYASSFDSCSGIVHCALTSLSLEYVKWMDQDEVIAISSDMFPSLQEFRLGYIERQVDITMRSNMLLSQVFSKEWRCLEAAELPFITDIMAFQIAKTCPKLKTLKAEICYNFSLPDPVEFGQWRHNDTVDIAWVGEYVLTNRGFLAIVQSCKNLFRLQIGLYSASHSHLLDQGIVFETSGANNDSIAVSRIWPTQPHLQPGEAVFAHDLPGVLVMPLEERQAQQAPDVRHHAHIDANDISIVPWACKDLVSLKLRELWFPTDTYAILLRQLPYLCNCIFEITDMDESVPLTAQGWETHKFMYEIEIRFRAQSSSWFCRQLFDLLPNLRVVYLSNYNADEKDLKRDYPYLTIRKRW